MYYKTTIKAGRTIEVYKSYRKRTGVVERGDRKKLTSEEMDRINQLNAERKLRIKLNANFKKGDPFITLTYRKELRPEIEQAKKDIKKLIRELRKYYKRQGEELKYILVTEYENKSIHHHLLLNDVDKIEKIVNDLWIYGRPNYKFLDETGQYKDLASYLIKETSKSYRKNRINGKGNKQRYSCSRNLIMPEAKVEVVKANKWLADPKAIKGYYIDQDTIINGVDPFTNREYQRYTMVQIDENGYDYNLFEKTG